MSDKIDSGNPVVDMVAERICEACRTLEYSIRPHGRAKDRTVDYEAIPYNVAEHINTLRGLVAILPSTTTSEGAMIEAPVSEPKRRRVKRTGTE